jgi:sister-chromatid-cohesion protein PDS5
MCEMAQILIKGRAQTHSWLLSTYPGKVRLPSDILRPLPTEAGNEVWNDYSVGPIRLLLRVILFKVQQTTYLPDEANDWLAERFRTGSSKVRFVFLSLLATSY